jgi:methylaspartate mutase epsilon subunit
MTSRRGLRAGRGGIRSAANRSRAAAGSPASPVQLASSCRAVRVSGCGVSDFLDFVQLDEARIAEEMRWIQREVSELIDPVLEASDLLSGIEAAFRQGTLDIPFSASMHAHSKIIPKRDASGAIRYLHSGALPFSALTLRHHALRLGEPAGSEQLLDDVTADINYFVNRETQPATRQLTIR